MKKLFALLAVFIVAQQALLCDNLNFTATVDRNPVTVGERFQVTFSLNGDGSDFKGPQFKGFTVLGGPAQSNNIQIVNGRMSRNLAFTYVLSADKIGEYTIESASINSGGNVLKSNPVKIKVLPETDAQKQRRQQQQQEEKSLNQQAQDLLKNNIFVVVFISKRDCYQGEEISATYKLYMNPQFQYNILDNKPGKFPTFDGFWSQEIPIDKLQFQRENYNGKIFDAAIIKQVVLFPQRSGKLNVDPYEFDFKVRLTVPRKKRSNDPFDSFFDDNFFFGGNYRDFDYTAKSQNVVVNVKPLKDGAPTGFNGAVGDLSMDAFLDKNATKANEPVTLRLKISGKGNLKLMTVPEVSFPPGFEVYDPKIEDNTNVSVNGVSGNITYEYLMIPRTPGTFKIPPVNFSYFDLSSQNYKTLTSKELEVRVGKGDANSPTAIAQGVRKEEVQLLGKDIRFIKTKAGEIEKFKGSFFGTMWFWLWLLLLLILFLLLLYYMQRKKKLRADSFLLRNQKATKIARKRLSSAKQCLAGNHKEKFYEEINKALWGYMSDKLGIPNSELTRDKINEKLSEKKVKPEHIEKFMKTLDFSEFARYAPTTGDEGMSQIYNSSVEIISDLEGSLK